MFVELHDKDTQEPVFVNFSYVEYFREMQRHGEIYTLVVLRDLQDTNEDFEGMNRYSVVETPHAIMSALREGTRK